jgi:hypothetical protein
MVMLNKAQQVFDMQDDQTIDVEVPEWKIDGETVTVRLKALTGTQRDQYEISLTRIVKGKGGQRDMVPNLVNSRARLVALCAIDEEGAPIFVGEAAALKLGMRNAKALDRLWQAAAELSGLDINGNEQEDDEKVEDFGEGPDDSSTIA